MSSDNPFETLADLERKKKMNAQQKGKQAGGQAKTGGKKKAPTTTKSGELTAQDRYQKEIQKIKDVLPHIPEDTVIKQLSELNGNVDLVLMKLLESDFGGDSSKNTSSSSKSTNAAKNTPPTTKATTTAAANNNVNQGFTQPKYHTKGARQADVKQSPSEVPKKFAGQGPANSRGYSQEGANNRTYPPNTNTYPAKGAAKGGSASSPQQQPQQTSGGRGGARDSNNYATGQQSRGGNAVLPKGPQPRDPQAKPATVMNYSAAVNRNMPAKPQYPTPQQQMSAAEALLATLEDDDFGEEEYQDFDPRDFLDEGAMGEDYIPDDYDPAEDEEVTQELNITESSVHTLTDSKDVTVNSVTVTTDTAITEPPSLLNGQVTRHMQEQHTVTEVVEVNNDKANNALAAPAGFEFPAERTNPNTVPAEAYQQLIVLNIQAAQRIATLETLLQQVAAKTEKLELQNNEMQTVCQQLVKTCLYLSEQQAKLQTAVSSNAYPQQQGGQQPPQAQPPQQPSSFPPQPSNQYPQQYQQPTAQAQSQAPQAKPQQGMLAQGPSQGVNPAQSAPQQSQPMPMYAQQQSNMNKQQQTGFAGQLPHGYPSMHHQYGSSPQNQSPLMQQQYYGQGNQPGYGFPPQGMHHNPAQSRGYPQFSPQYMQGQHMGLDPEIIEGIVRDQRNVAEQMK
eukprot:TRINITY_DN1044_c0_g1_i1.p1 TRINITY_DN1044_c0_g1~~TRINITY_DN1044_c0_g1_i1.p1  ORF type:complete len:675 (+),score=241.62 TRINITY_DN1044_c0_g1_i1:2197-4221(+)